MAKKASKISKSAIRGRPRGIGKAVRWGTLTSIAEIREKSVVTTRNEAAVPIPKGIRENIGNSRFG